MATRARRSNTCVAADRSGRLSRRLPNGYADPSIACSCFPEASDRFGVFFGPGSIPQVRAQERLDLVGEHGSREEVPLVLLAALVDQERQLLSGLDALGNHAQPEVLGERDDG